MPEDRSHHLLPALKSISLLLKEDDVEGIIIRDFDSIHLASALKLRKELSSPVTFSCFDDNLYKASIVEDLIQE